MPQIFCRPHVKTITPAMRFVVASGRGVDTGQKKYAMGEEFPGDAVNVVTLRQLYDQHRLNLMPESVGEAHAPTPEAVATPVYTKSDIMGMTTSQVTGLLKRHGLPLTGKLDVLRDRLLGVTDRSPAPI